MSTANPLVYVATVGVLTAIQAYANDAAFVSAKGSAAAAGDFYVNTTDAMIHFYDATLGWVREVRESGDQGIISQQVFS